MKLEILILGATLLVMGYAGVVPRGYAEKDNCTVTLEWICSESTTMCTRKPKNYPQQCIDRLINEVDKELIENPDYQVAVHRSGEQGYNDDDCAKMEEKNRQLIYQIKDTEGNVRVVVQTANYTQNLTRQGCKHPGSRLQLINRNTKHFTPRQMADNKIYCEEIRMEFNFLVLRLDGTGVEFVKSRDGVPVACRLRVGDEM